MGRLAEQLGRPANLNDLTSDLIDKFRFKPTIDSIYLMIKHNFTSRDDFIN